MSNTPAATTAPETTHVKGYFNPNPYIIQVAISECNLSVRLEPMQFVMDRRTGKKINDPLLDRYVGPKALSPEVSDTPVPVIRIPLVALPVSASPGYVVGQGHKDKTGKWVPPTIANQPAALANVTTADGHPIVASKPSIQAMSVEEARRAGLIGKPKFVPEDYGAAEQDGAPVEGGKIPRIKYAMESRPKVAAALPSALPKELVEQVSPKVAPILAGLQAAASRDPEAVSLGRKAAEEAVGEQMGQEGVQQFRKQVKQVKSQAQPAPAPTAPMPQPVAPVPPPPSRKRVAQPMAPVQVPAPAPVSDADNPLMGGRPDDLPSPDLGETQQPVTEADRQAGPIRCGACGKEFKYESWYVRHVRSAHRDRIAELLPTQAP